jgi:hypothetical protein
METAGVAGVSGAGAFPPPQAVSAAIKTRNRHSFFNAYPTFLIAYQTYYTIKSKEWQRFLAFAFANLASMVKTCYADKAGWFADMKGE